MNICMVSDFFYPNLGGVENHIYQLSCYLQRLNHKVVVLTHRYKDRQGIRYMGNGIKVYYLPFKPLKPNILLPDLGISTMDIIRTIAISEDIQVFHTHQYTSPLAQDAILVSALLEIPVVTTEHSLFAFNDLACVNINKVITTLQPDIDAIIAVSYIGKENLAMRTGQSLDKITVTPNCIDFSKFSPDIKLQNTEKDSNLNNNIDKLNVNHCNSFNQYGKPVFDPNLIPYKNQYYYNDNISKSNNTNKDNSNNNINYINYKKVTVISISRQTYRKGTDLLIDVIPVLYKIFPNMDFIIGGDGEKKYLLDKMVDYFNMSDRVKLTGGLPHHKVKEVMKQGEIYLNTSLTEAFCIAILEAASTGLFVVSTNIGGVEEVLPPHMRLLVDAKKEELIEGVIHAVEQLDKIKTPNCSIKSNYKEEHKENNKEIKGVISSNQGSSDFHSELKDCYNWYNNAIIVESVYSKVRKNDKSQLKRYSRILKNGNFSSIFYLLIILCQSLIFMLISCLKPASYIKKKYPVKKFNREKYIAFLNENKSKLV